MEKVKDEGTNSATPSTCVWEPNREVCVRPVGQVCGGSGGEGSTGTEGTAPESPGRQSPKERDGKQNHPGARIKALKADTYNRLQDENAGSQGQRVWG